MSRNYATDYVVHAFGMGAACRRRARDWVASEVRSDVTCKRCLASLAKRDREFQRKSRRWWTYPRGWRPEGLGFTRNGLDIVHRSPRAYAYNPTYGLALDAARAIAAEEARA